MKGFLVDIYGDVVMEKKDIKLVYGTDLLIQKIRQVLSTNRGEWWLNPKEGIPMQKVLRKNPNLAMVRDYVRNAVSQVDPSLQMTRCDIMTEGRMLRITFSVSSADADATAEVEV